MTTQIYPEQKNVWQLRVSLSKSDKLSSDDRFFIPSFDVGKTFNSQVIAVGVKVLNSKANWRHGGYLSQEFSFASKGYNYSLNKLIVLGFI